MELLYPEHIELEVKNRAIVLATIPEEFRLIEAAQHHTKQVSTARGLYEHIVAEKEFWTDDLVKNIAIVSDYPDVLNRALLSFNAFVKSDGSRAQKELTKVLDLLGTCKISAKTRLAKTFAGFQSKSAWFFKGFIDALTASNDSHGNHADWHKGLAAGHKYKGDIHNIYDIFTWQPPSRFSFPHR